MKISAEQWMLGAVLLLIFGILLIVIGTVSICLMAIGIWPIACVWATITAFVLGIIFICVQGYFFYMCGKEAY